MRCFVTTRAVTHCCYLIITVVVPAVTPASAAASAAIVAGAFPAPAAPTSASYISHY